MFRSIGLPELMVLFVVGVPIAFVFVLYAIARRKLRRLSLPPTQARWSALAIWIAVGLILATGMYPPWIQSWEYVDGGNHPRIGPGAERYSWIFQPPGIPEWIEALGAVGKDDSPSVVAFKTPGFWRSQIDLGRLGVEWAMTAAVLAAILATVRDQKPIPIATLIPDREAAQSPERDSTPPKSKPFRIATNNPPKTCPACGITNPYSALRCDCGADFDA